MNSKHARVFRRFFTWAGVTLGPEMKARKAAFDRQTDREKAETIRKLEAAMAADPKPLSRARTLDRFADPAGHK